MLEIDRKYYKRNKLSSKMLSNYVLLPISCFSEPPEEIVHALGISNEVNKLKEIYNRYSCNSFEDKLAPRFLPFYKYLKEEIPEFDWNFHVKEEQVISSLNKPFFSNGRPTLLNMLLKSIKGDVDLYPALKLKYKALKDIPNEVVANLENNLNNNNFFIPQESYWSAISKLIKKALEGEKIVLVSVICPDYSYEKKGNSYKYTFTSINDGIGLVANRAIKGLSAIIEFFKKCDIDYEVIIAGGDFEGLDKSILKKVKEDEANFFKKVKKSQEKTINELKKITDKKISPFLFVDNPSKKQKWQKLKSDIKNKLIKGEIGQIDKKTFDPATLLDSRLPLYKSWYPNKSKKEYQELLFTQGAEYSAMGQIFSENFDNHFVIGADHLAMMPFYNMNNITPILYLKKGY